MTSRSILFGICLLAAHAAQAQATKPLTSVSDAYPSASPDGRRIAFHSDRSGTTQIHVVNADGSGLQRLTDHPEGGHTPKWSPDGKRLVYARSANASSDIWMMQADGSDQHVLVATAGDDSHPQWTPDGASIIFNTSRPAPRTGSAEPQVWDDIHIVRSDGSGLRRITDCKGTCTYPSLSPDGRHLVYRRVEASPGFNWVLGNIARNSEVFVVGMDGSGQRNLSNSPAFDGWPAWSPTGEWIAFTSNRAGAAYAGQVYLIRPDGSGLKQLTTGPWSHVQPAWAADGKSLHVYRFQENAEGGFGQIAQVLLPTE